MPFTLGFLGFSDAFDAVEVSTDTGANFLENFGCLGQGAAPLKLTIAVRP